MGADALETVARNLKRAERERRRRPVPRTREDAAGPITPGSNEVYRGLEPLWASGTISDTGVDIGTSPGHEVEIVVGALDPDLTTGTAFTVWRVTVSAFDPMVTIDDVFYVDLTTNPSGGADTGRVLGTSSSLTAHVWMVGPPSTTADYRIRGRRAGLSATAVDWTVNTSMSLTLYGTRDLTPGDA